MARRKTRKTKAKKQNPSNPNALGRREKIPWAAVESEYVYGIRKDNELHHPSYEELAQRYRVKKVTVAKHGREKNWVEKRQKAMRQEARSRMKEREDYLIDESLHAEKQELQITKILRMICYSKITEMRVNEEGKPEQVANFDIDLTELRSISKVFETAHNIRDKITKSVFDEYDRFVRQTQAEEQPKYIIQLPDNLVQKYDKKETERDKLAVERAQDRYDNIQGEIEGSEEEEIDDAFSQVRKAKLNNSDEGQEASEQ